MIAARKFLSSSCSRLGSLSWARSTAIRSWLAMADSEPELRSASVTAPSLKSDPVSIPQPAVQLVSKSEPASASASAASPKLERMPGTSLRSESEPGYVPGRECVSGPSTRPGVTSVRGPAPETRPGPKLPVSTSWPAVETSSEPGPAPEPGPGPEPDLVLEQGPGPYPEV